MSTNAFDPAAAIGYYRVSTPRQEEEGHGAERYLERLEAVGIAPTDIYFDAESGGKYDRSDLQKALLRLQESTKKYFVIPYHSRLHRDVGVWAQIRDVILENDCELIELDKGLTPRDIVSAAGGLQANLDAAFAQYQRDQAREHSIQGHKFRQSQNRCQQPCFGYRKNDDKKMVINDELFPGGQGKTYRQIAIEMIDILIEVGGYRATVKIMCDRYGETHPDRKGVGSNFPRSTKGFMSWVTSPLLRGYLVDFPGKKNELIREGEHEVIMDPARWKAVQRTIEYIKNIPRAFNNKPRTRRPLAGKIKCGMCGGRLTRSSSSPRGTKTYSYLICRGGSESSNPSRINRVCPFTNSIKEEDFFGEVFEQVCDHASSIAKHFAEPIVEENPQIAKLKLDIETLQAMNDSLLSEAIRTKQKQLADLEKSMEPEGDDSNLELYEIVASDPEYWESLEPHELRIVLDSLIKQVVVLGAEESPEQRLKISFYH
ncbi:MAG: recombinase family protein [Cyanobacteria bacterium P01_D01_bin.128]